MRMNPSRIRSYVWCLDDVDEKPLLERLEYNRYSYG